MKTCTHEGCQAKHYAKGSCRKHYLADWSDQPTGKRHLATKVKRRREQRRLVAEQKKVERLADLQAYIAGMPARQAADLELLRTLEDLRPMPSWLCRQLDIPEDALHGYLKNRLAIREDLASRIHATLSSVASQKQASPLEEVRTLARTALELLDARRLLT